ncbi:MAG: response regulator transcription factor [Cyclobacteriaceae bacterium]|nr:response regulator transcription factor [Cyclobacteriaceae bacterium]
MTKKLTIYLADDHTVVRKGMTRLFNTFARVGSVKEAGNGAELLELVEKRRPDAVVLDVEMPVMGGMEAAKHLSDLFPEVKILILTMHTEEAIIIRLMDIGVHGFLSKAAEPAEVETALYAIVDRDFYRNEIVEHALIRAASIPKQVRTPLSAREIEVLLLICEDLSPQEIGDRLGITQHTYFNHRAHILSKTDMRTNVGLVKFAYQAGLIKFGPLTTR